LKKAAFLVKNLSNFYLFEKNLTLYLIKALIMKALIRLFLFVAIAVGLNTVNAQSTKADKKAAKAAAVAKMVKDTSFVFEATTANPQRGGQKQLSSPYDLKVTRSDVTAFLPYYGVSHMAPNPGSSDGGIKFTSKSFSYAPTQSKKGNWNVMIKPKDKNMTDWRNVDQLTFNISSDGYASLHVLSSNRDAISFNGSITEVKAEGEK
jgi:hypothetical protein